MRYGGLEGTYGGFGAVVATGKIDGAVIGGTTPAAITGTTITATTAFVAGSSSDAFLTRYAAKQVAITGDGTGATTNAGVIIGYEGNSGTSAIWSSTVTPAVGNYALRTSGSITAIGASVGGAVQLAPGNTAKLTVNDVAGQGPSITATTATTDVNALSIAQTWNGGAVAFKGIKQIITDTASAAGSVDMSLERANGQGIQFANLSELTTIAAAATTDTTIQMPAGAVILGVSVRVTVVIPTATTFTVGDSGSAARFSTAAVSVAANSTDRGTKAGAYYNASALAVRITPNGTPAANTGRVRVTIHYYTVTPPTS